MADLAMFHHLNLQGYKWQNSWKSLLIIGLKTGAGPNTCNTNFESDTINRGRSGGPVVNPTGKPHLGQRLHSAAATLLNKVTFCCFIMLQKHL